MEHKFKVGDLVKWARWGTEDVGVVLPLPKAYADEATQCLHIAWFGGTVPHGIYDWVSGNKNLKVISVIDNKGKRNSEES